MKNILTIILLLCVGKIYGQEWHLNKVDKDVKFKYQYWFRFDNTEDTSSFNLEKKFGHGNSRVHIADNQGDTVSFEKLKITNLSNDSIIITWTDLNGFGQFNLLPGKYKIEIVAVNYDHFSLDLDLAEDEYFQLSVRLGLASELAVYQINAKHKLREKTIIGIMQCVKENKERFNEHCSDNKKYRLVMQI